MNLKAEIDLFSLSFLLLFLSPALKRVKLVYEKANETTDDLHASLEPNKTSPENEKAIERKFKAWRGMVKEHQINGAPRYHFSRSRLCE